MWNIIYRKLSSKRISHNRARCQNWHWENEQLEGSWTRWDERLLVQKVHCSSPNVGRGTCRIFVKRRCPGMDGYWTNSAHSEGPCKRYCCWQLLTHNMFTNDVETVNRESLQGRFMITWSTETSFRMNRRDAGKNLGALKTSSLLTKLC